MLPKQDEKLSAPTTQAHEVSFDFRSEYTLLWQQKKKLATGLRFTLDLNEFTKDLLNRFHRIYDSTAFMNAFFQKKSIRSKLHKARSLIS